MKIYKIAQTNKIFEIANLVRSRLLNYHCDSEDEQCLRALCLEASRELRDEYLKNGINAIVVQGTFYVDNPNENFDEEYDDETYNNPLHYWVEINGEIIDITADQFNDELDGETMEGITIGGYSELTRYTVSRRGWK
jgi:hypothetical protein